jgi:hypothetical protein
MLLKGIKLPVVSLIVAQHRFESYERDTSNQYNPTAKLGLLFPARLLISDAVAPDSSWYVDGSILLSGLMVPRFTAAKLDHPWAGADGVASGLAAGKKSHLPQ